MFDEILGQARELGHDALTSWALSGVCQVLVAVGDADRAEPLANELLTLTRNTHDPETVSSADHFLADCAMIRGDYTLCERHFQSALEGALRARNLGQQSFEVLGIAFGAAALGRHEHAVRLEGAVAAQWEDLGISSAVPFIEERRAQLIGAARRARTRSSGRRVRRGARDRLEPSHKTRARSDSVTMETSASGTRFSVPVPRHKHRVPTALGNSAPCWASVLSLERQSGTKTTL